MTEKDAIYLEEVLIAFLKSSKKVKILDCDKDTGDTTKLCVTFEVENDFGSTLVNGLDNKFAQFFNNEYITSKKQEV